MMSDYYKSCRALERVENLKPLAVYCMSNFGGIEIIDTGEWMDTVIFYRFNFGQPKRVHFAKVYETATGRGYFRAYNGMRVYLDECMRV